ncbi:MAG: hypothetical protein QM802_19500 [Agriterribacter sp.]
MAALEKAAMEEAKEADTLGPVIFEIELKLSPTEEDVKNFGNEPVPWINLIKTDTELSRLIDADEIVLPFSQATLFIDYPLAKPVVFELSATEKGFSRKQLIEEISKKYHQIYEEEESSATVKTVPADKRKGLINRNETNGKYGIWGHDLSDLALSSIEVHKNKDGKIYLVPGIES